MASTQTTDGLTSLANTALVAGEAVLPGASNIVAGNIGAGIGHLIGTSVAVALLAPVSPLLAGLAAIGLRANSYKLATTGTGLLTSLRNSDAASDLAAAVSAKSAAATKASN